MNLIFATHNQHKLKEINSKLGNRHTIESLDTYNITEDIPETGKTLEENASQKAWYLYNKIGKNCFADDTGLEVEALGNMPGVYSARYAGLQKSYDDNNNKLLHELKGNNNRKARFRTVVTLVLNGKEYNFEGIVSGRILLQKRGSSGFGYDPLFLPDGYTTSFAEMSLEEKNKISHRARAIEKLVKFLSKIKS